MRKKICRKNYGKQKNPKRMANINAETHNDSFTKNSL